mgnify:CR=1 FL=1
MKSLDAESQLRINTDGDLWTLDYVWQGRRLGRITATRNGKRLLIGDFLVDNPQNRGHGIGKCLLDEFLKTAREEAISEVWGSVTQDDIQQTPYLLDWYQRLGFTISEPDGECIETAAKKIVLKLKGEEAARALNH